MMPAALVFSRSLRSSDASEAAATGEGSLVDFGPVTAQY
jgi:hypothetical protein